MRRIVTQAALLWIVLGTVNGTASAQDQSSSKVQMTAKDAALFDMTGYWVSIVDEDWRWRMLTPPKGDYASIPLNEDGRKLADTWDLVKDEAQGNQCRAYGAAGIMRQPTRLHITWADANKLRIDTDAGMQERLFHFDAVRSNIGAPTWQGESVADWEKQTQSKNRAVSSFGGAVPGKGGTLHVVTTHMRPGYYRANGVPYSGNAVLIEFFDRVELNSDSYLIVTTVVQDPQYLREQFITSEQFRHEPDGAKWHPTPCETEKPTR
jgi:hypothetical protein